VVLFWIWSYWYRIGWVLSYRLYDNKSIRTDWLLIQTGRVCWSRAYLKILDYDKHKNSDDRSSILFRYDKMSVQDSLWNYRIETSRSPGLSETNILGIQWLSYINPRRRGDYGWELAIPCSYFCASASLFFLLSARFVMRQRTTKHRQKAGLCPKCGYDLRASPDRCPECGTPANPATSTV
jgi:hypothetical protein